MLRRSILFSPGDQPDILRKAPTSDADVVVFDLEDAVVPSKKAEAREAVKSVLVERNPDCEVCVRINPLSEGGDDDLAAVLDGSPDSIMLPKVDDAAAIDSLDAALADHGVDLPVLALLETASGVLDAREIAAAAATDAVLLGAEDLSADLGATRTRDGAEISYARQRVVLAASAAGVDAIDTLHTDFEDTAGLRADAEFAVGLGFDGKMAIHPAQATVINEAFTPDDDEIEWATRVLEARDEASEEGRGVFVVDDEMIDAPLIAQAETILERAGERDTER